MWNSQPEGGPRVLKEHPNHVTPQAQESNTPSIGGNKKATPNRQENPVSLKQDVKGEPKAHVARHVDPKDSRSNAISSTTRALVDDRRRHGFGLFRRSTQGRGSISSSTKVETEGNGIANGQVAYQRPSASHDGPIRPNPLKPNRWNFETDPWQPIVLSLDGGGIRGLSSLYILKELMEQIRIEEERVERQNLRPITTASGWETANGVVPRRQKDTLPLPCHYFDFIIGTSTGGLIAVMLGRLRMDVDKCIDAYKALGVDIFGSWRWWRLTKYDYKDLENAIRDVVRTNCVEHGDTDTCNGEHDLLRQYDFSCEDCPYKNRSCKVALMSIQEGERGSADTPYMFRSYDHQEAIPQQYQSFDDTELNPGRVQRNATTIWEACRATSAAPLYFSQVMIRGVRYMDGGVGVGANNPAVFALNEANQMAQRHGQPKSIAALISVGTGQKKAQSRFKNIFAVANQARKLITETQGPHITAQSRLTHTPYYRFDVLPPPDKSVDPGLSKMGLDECKKKKWKKSERPATGTTIGSLDETKFQYTTYEKIKTCTQAYCSQKKPSVTVPKNVEAELIEAAAVLVWYSRRRQHNDTARWDEFTTHPYL